MTDKQTAWLGVVVGVLGVLLGSVATYIAIATSPWATHNDLYCYGLEMTNSDTNWVCEYTRSGCENKQSTENENKIEFRCRKYNGHPKDSLYGGYGDSGG